MDEPTGRVVRFIGGPIDGETRTVPTLTHLVAPWDDDSMERFTYTLSQTLSGEWIGATGPVDTFQIVMPFAEHVPDEVMADAREEAIREWWRALRRIGATAVSEPIATPENDLAHGKHWRVVGSALP